jgi:hypothetical protein
VSRFFADLFHLELSEAEERFGEAAAVLLRQAAEDFNAVLEGDRPIHAVVDETKPLPLDGGTAFYRGEGYSLTVVKSLNGVMRGKEYISGYIYGPIVHFDGVLMVGNYPQISQLSFYPERVMYDLLNKRS